MSLKKPTLIAVYCGLGFCAFAVGTLLGMLWCMPEHATFNQRFDAVSTPLPHVHDTTTVPLLTVPPPHDNHGYPDVIHLAPASAAGPSAAPLAVMPSMPNRDSAVGWCAGFGTAVRMVLYNRDMLRIVFGSKIKRESYDDVIQRLAAANNQIGLPEGSPPPKDGDAIVGRIAGDMLDAIDLYLVLPPASFDIPVHGDRDLPCDPLNFYDPAR